MGFLLRKNHLILFFLSLVLAVFFALFFYLKSVSGELFVCPTFDRSPVARGAILEWFQKPAAVRHVGVHDRTYISWVTSDGKIQVRYFDHTTKTFSDTKTVDDLGQDFGIEARDDHNAPSLLILPDGRLLIFYAVHDVNNAFFMKISGAPEDISSWGDRTVIADEGTRTPYNYPQAKLLDDGTIALFYRRGNYYNSDEYYKISKDAGKSFGTPTALIDFGADGVYAFVYVQNNNIHVAWNKSISDPPRKDVYYMYSPDGGKTWKKKNGDDLPLPVTAENADIVFDSKNDRAYVWDIVVDSTQEPYIVFAHKQDPFHEFRFARWSGTAWVTSLITSSAQLYRNGNFYSGGIVLDPDDPFTVYLSKKRDVLEIEKWQSSDGGLRWRLSESITQDSAVDNFRLQVVKNYAPELRLIWSSGVYEGLVDGNWTGYDKVNIQSEVTKNSIPKSNCTEKEFFVFGKRLMLPSVYLERLGFGV